MATLRSLAGILLASIVLYMWGFLFWGLAPFQEWTMLTATDDVEARDALRELFPQNGSYLIPAPDDDMAALGVRYQEGPIALVHMLRVEGRPLMHAPIMISGFLLNTVVIGLLAAILAIAARPRYWERVQLCGAIGLAAALLINYGGVVWWEISRPWELYNALYHFTFCLLAGVILGAFVRPRPTASATA